MHGHTHWSSHEIEISKDFYYNCIMKSCRRENTVLFESTRCMSSWSTQQQKILMALTPRQYSIDETRQNRKTEQDSHFAIFPARIQRQEKQDDKFCLSIDHPRMRYAEVESLVALFNFDARTDSQTNVGKESKVNGCTSHSSAL